MLTDRSSDSDRRVAEARRHRAVADMRHLERLALVARRNAVQTVTGPVCNRVALRPELRCDAAEGAILQQATDSAVTNLPTHFAAEAERESSIVDAQAAIGLHQHALFCACDDVLQTGLAWLDGHIGHAHQRHAIPPIGT